MGGPNREVFGMGTLISCSRRGTHWPLAKVLQLGQDSILNKKIKNKIKQLNYTLLGGEWNVCDVFDYFLFPETKFIVMFKYNSLYCLLKTWKASKHAFITGTFKKMFLTTFIFSYIVYIVGSLKELLAVLKKWGIKNK